MVEYAEAAVPPPDQLDEGNPVSFSFNAGGTRAETLKSLSAPLTQPDGEKARQLVRGIISDASADERIRFEVSAHGHSGEAQVPYLEISIKTRYDGA